jgi:hypothetical protein
MRNGSCLPPSDAGLQPNRFRVVDVSELCGTPATGPSTLRVRAPSPIQVTGIELSPVRFLLHNYYDVTSPARGISAYDSIVHKTIPLAGLLMLAIVPRTFGQERPYFVTYDHYLEERGNLEIAIATTTGIPKNDQATYTAPWLELEYGITGWWTTELYLEGVTTRGDGRGFTGWRWEHRVRPLKTEHFLNPVVYLEYESINEASRIQKEIVGAGAMEFEPIDELREEHEHEIEAKLILSSTSGNWNVAENFVVEKNLTEDEGFEFGYSVGVSRGLGGLASPGPCRVCAENFRVGVELYGGLGSSEGFGRSEQRHYVAPVVSWRFANRWVARGSVAVGLTETSDRALVRLGAAYEFPLGRR